MLEDHLIGRQESADQSAAGVQYLGYECVAREFEFSDKHDHSKHHNGSIDPLDEDLLPVLEVLLTELISLVVDEVFPEGLELIDYFFHAFDSGLMLVVVAKHLEDYFEKGKKVLIGLKTT